MSFSAVRVLSVNFVTGTDGSNFVGTYTGHYEPVKEMSNLLDEYEKKTGHSVPIHG